LVDGVAGCAGGRGKAGILPYEVIYDSEHDCIVTRIDGRLDVPVVREFLAELGRVISTNDCGRILEDLRGAELTLSMEALYFAPRLVPEAGIPPASKSAIVVAEQDWSVYSYLETVARNLGQNTKVFTDPDEARRWLMR
jgi:hypothetical protein